MKVSFASGLFSPSMFPTFYGIYHDRRIIAKRMADIIVASIALCLLSPIMLIFAVLIFLTSRGPVVFTQTRVGLNGKPFTMYKFRSMYMPNDCPKAQKEKLIKSRDGICLKYKNDPRVTLVGRIMRKTSIDELPQFFNVILGTMSIVGPRPALEKEVAQYSPRALQRLNAIPGITGVWQVSGRADISFEDMVTMDIEYSQQQNLWLDLKIMFLTVPAVLSGRGAY